ncbi:MAG: hypothetical protein N5840_05650 [Lactobacillus iners]|uniref:Uncharacterized protein n=1 Tax=Lactobacillus iners LactinV 01V1-a TaxID=879297 RepID=E1NTZ9_9LACO|nr:hypothetical protein HMPREF9211_1070 [Lactobacillus iners LactinV 01V1-a]MCT7719448.1 hypothetical protein [Lactobacillus iners]MCT7868523.1 hypothetical protein [Lactobacillus iners]
MKVSIWTAIIVIIVGLYDLAYAFNRRQDLHDKSSCFKKRRMGIIGFIILGIIFVLLGVFLLFVGER